jgi:hypothetical protein
MFVFQQLLLDEVHISGGSSPSFTSCSSGFNCFWAHFSFSDCHLAWCGFLLWKHELFLCLLLVTESDGSCLNISKEKYLCLENCLLVYYTMKSDTNWLTFHKRCCISETLFQFLPDFMVQHLRRQSSLYLPLWEPEISPICALLA